MNENAARVDWAGVGKRIPRRWLGPRSLRLAVQAALRPPVRARAAAVARWAAAHDGAETAALELEAGPQALIPPSSGIVAPVMNALSSEARKSTS